MQTCHTCLRKRKAAIMPSTDEKARGIETKIILDEGRATHGSTSKIIDWMPELRARNYQLNILKNRGVLSCLPCIENAIEETLAFINYKTTENYMALMLKCAENAKKEKEGATEKDVIEDKVEPKTQSKSINKVKSKRLAVKNRDVVESEELDEESMTS